MPLIFAWVLAMYQVLIFPASTQAKIKGTVSPYKRIFSNRSRMGIPNYVWASGILMSRSYHLPVPSWLLDLCDRVHDVEDRHSLQCISNVFTKFTSGVSEDTSPILTCNMVAPPWTWICPLLKFATILLPLLIKILKLT